MIKAKPLIVLVILAVLCVSLLGCNNKSDYEGFVFGTSFSLHLSEKKANTTIKTIKSELQSLDNHLSTTIIDSDIYTINNSTENIPISVSEATVFLFKEARALNIGTQNAFNPAIFPLVELWKFDPTNFTGIANSIPSSSEISETLTLCDFDYFILDEEAKTITKLHPNAKLDFGAFAKGYAIDRALSHIEENGFVVLGGSVGVKGDSKRIGIESPRNSSSLFGIVDLHDGQIISTSGDYERYYQYDNKDYHHIIGRDGYPTGHNKINPIISLSIITNNGLIADALSTAFMDFSLEEIQSFSLFYDFKGIIIFEDKTFKTIGDLDFELNNNDYVKIL